MFWEDPWINGIGVASIAPAVLALVKPAACRCRTMQEGLINHAWATDISDPLSVDAVVQYLWLWAAVAAVERADGQDELSWKWTSDGCFTSRSAYQMLFEGTTTLPGATNVWNAFAPLKFKFHSWLALRGRCWTADRMCRRGMAAHTTCPLCNIDDESLIHISLHCTFSAVITKLERSSRANWNLAIRWPRLRRRTPSSSLTRLRATSSRSWSSPTASSTTASTSPSSTPSTNHDRVMAAADVATTTFTGSSAGGGRLRLVAVSDGIEDAGEHQNLVLLNTAMQVANPPQLEPLLDGDGEGLGKVTCVVVDVAMSFALDVVKRRGITSAALWPASAAVLWTMVNAGKLIRDGVINDDGAPLNLKNNSFHLTESTPPMDATFLAWNYLGNREAERMVFHYLDSIAQTAATKADYLLCNTFADIEPAIFTSPTPTNIIPIGPLRTWRRPTRHAPVGHFWHTEDATCMSFLDTQPRGSVVYVAFGSINIMTAEQVHELALGLQASGRPFLWVVRPEQADKLPIWFSDDVDGFGNGKVVGWAPQE
ncbi:hypothetical protein ACQ4PT_059429 [Festuca glaucescens]